MPEVASRHHLELVNAVVDEALRERRHRAARRRRGRRDQPAGPDRGAAGRPLDRQGAGRGRAPAVRRRRPPARPRGGQLPRARPDRPAVPVPDRERRPHAAGARSRSRDGYERARLDPRRRGRRGARQGGAHDGPGLSRAAPRSTAWRARATRERSTSRSACAAATRSTSASAGSRPRSSTRCASSGPSRHARAARRPRGLVPARGRRLADAEARAGARAHRRRRAWRSAAGWRPTRSCAGAWPRCASAAGLELKIPPPALCTDNAAMIASAAQVPRAGPVS